MKKIKLLTSLAATATLCGVITPLTSCGISAAEDAKINFTINSISLSKEFFEVVTFTTTKNANGDYDIKFKSKKSSYIIPSVRAIVAGELSLEPDEYSYDITTQTLTIKFSAIERVKGKALTIIPNNLILNKVKRLEVTCAKSSVNVGDTLKEDELTVNAVYLDGTITKNPLKYGRDYALFDLHGKINSLSSGYKFANEGEWELYVVYLYDSSVYSTIKFEVAKPTVQTITINVTGVHCNVEPSSITVEIGKTWGEIKQQFTVTPDQDYSLDGWVVEGSDGPIDPDTIINESINVYCYCSQSGSSATEEQQASSSFTIVVPSMNDDIVRNFYSYYGDNETIFDESTTFNGQEVNFVCPQDGQTYEEFLDSLFVQGNPEFYDIIVLDQNLVNKYAVLGCTQNLVGDEGYMYNDAFNGLANMYPATLSFSDNPTTPAGITRLDAVTDTLNPCVYLYNRHYVEDTLNSSAGEIKNALGTEDDIVAFIDEYTNRGFDLPPMFASIESLIASMKNKYSHTWGNYSDDVSIASAYAYITDRLHDIYNGLKQVYDTGTISNLTFFTIDEFASICNGESLGNIVPLSYLTKIVNDSEWADYYSYTLTQTNNPYTLDIVAPYVGSYDYNNRYFIVPVNACHTESTALFFSRMTDVDGNRLTATKLLNNYKFANHQDEVQAAINDDSRCWDRIVSEDENVEFYAEGPEIKADGAPRYILSELHESAMYILQPAKLTYPQYFQYSYWDSSIAEIFAEEFINYNESYDDFLNAYREHLEGEGFTVQEI